jgi:hypothetical protein
LPRIIQKEVNAGLAAQFLGVALLNTARLAARSFIECCMGCGSHASKNISLHISSDSFHDIRGSIQV